MYEVPGVYERPMLLEQIWLEIERRPLFAKYDRLFQERILHKIKLKEEISRFSWGSLYVEIHALGTSLDPKPSIAVAADLELIGFASRMLDDLLDEDNPRIEQSIGRANTLILFTEILIESFGRLHRLVPGESERIQQELANALHGEWTDINFTALDGIGEHDYMQQILPKTASIFKLVAVCADPDRTKFWDEFLTYASLALQLSNDMAALYVEAKSDLGKLRPTLPILKAIDVEDEEVRERRSFMMRSYAAGSGSLEAARSAIEESGALEYCYLIRELHKEKCREMLSEQFPDRLAQTEALFRVLQLEAE